MVRADDQAPTVSHVREVTRTCVGCRQRAAKQELLRVVAGDLGHGPTVLPDPAGRALGRGAHLHQTPQCLDLALRRRAFPRALRLGGPLATDVVEEYVRQHPQQENRP